MENYLVIAALGKDRPGIVDKLSMIILDCSCNIVDSRMTVLGGEFALILMVSGKWNELVKLEDTFTELRKELDLTITTRRTEEERTNVSTISYNVEAISIDHPGIVYQISNFFCKKSINIRELNTNRYAAAHSGTPMFTLSMIVSLPAKMRIANLREEFLEFCDELNLDAVIEPVKG